MGVRKPQKHTEIRQKKKTQTASDFFPNIETARAWMEAT